MPKYSNRGGDSGIDSYDTSPESITVHFSDGATYRYTYASAGSGAIERMKQLAESGQGLNSYINKYVKKSYESKLK